MKKQARVSTGAVYTYFRSKEEMIAAILEGAREDRRRQLEGATGAGDRATDQALVLLGWITEIFAAQGRHAARVDVNLWAEALRSRRVEKLARDALGEAVSAVRTVVAPRLGESRETAGLEPDAVASVLIAIFLGLEVQVAVGMPVDAAGVLPVLGTLFADFLPGNETPARPGKKRRSRARKGRA